MFQDGNRTVSSVYRFQLLLMIKHIRTYENENQQNDRLYIGKYLLNCCK